MKYSLIYNFNETLTQFGNIIYYKSGLSIINYTSIMLFSTWLLLLSYFNSEVNYLCNTMTTYVYWIILGILSSVGFGTGLQTGVIFVYPKIIESYTYNYDPTLSINTNIITTYIRCIPFVGAWSIGTVLGELPPYLIAKTINYKDNGSLDRLYAILGDSSDTIKNSIDNTVNKLKKGTRYSFITIILLSCWPNAMFDICGIASGLVRLDIYQFILPTFIGKTCIKTPIQLFLFLYYYANYGNSLHSNLDLGYLYYVCTGCVISFTLYFIKISVETVVNNESIKIT